MPGRTRLAGSGTVMRSVDMNWPRTKASVRCQGRAARAGFRLIERSRVQDRRGLQKRVDEVVVEEGIGSVDLVTAGGLGEHQLDLVRAGQHRIDGARPQHHAGVRLEVVQPQDMGTPE